MLDTKDEKMQKNTAKKHCLNKMDPGSEKVRLIKLSL